MKRRNVTCDLAPITCESAPTTLIAWSRHVAIRACIPTTSARPGIGNRAFVIADRMGALAFVELNTDGTPIGPTACVNNREKCANPSYRYPALCHPECPLIRKETGNFSMDDREQELKEVPHRLADKSRWPKG